MFDKRFDAIDARFEAIDARFETMVAEFSKINGKIDQLQRYQATESIAIEFDLKMVLQKYLETKYPRMSVGSFPMKTITDLSNNPITDLDAAFLVSSTSIIPDRYQLEKQGFPPDIIQPNNVPTSSILVIAEAKHNINADKIATKLYQFDKIKTYIRVLRDSTNNASPAISKITRRNNYLLSISDFNFFFGAAFWQERLAKDLECAIKKHRKLCTYFKTATGTKKIALYKQICTLQKIWYRDNPTPCNPSLSDPAILQLTEIDSSINQVELIVPSGDRYVVLQEKQPEGMAIGGRRTRTRKPK